MREQDIIRLLKDKIAVVQAFIDGKAIEYRSLSTGEWSDCTEPLWLAGGDYRIKRREFWINVYSYGFSGLHTTREETDKCAGANRLECLHLVETN